jgi:predicted NBD/HSP70 family sugar kinase
MRKINTRHFHVATRSTPRQVNRQIVLNLIREHQPISRAELARRMAVARGALTTLVRELVADGVVYEEDTTTAMAGPGRPPTLLRLRTSGRLALAADVRPSRTSLALADIGGRMLAQEVVPTPDSPDALVGLLAARGRRLLDGHAAGEGQCQGVGLVVPGMVDRQSGRVLYAPRLGWRNVELRGALAASLGLPVFVESAPIACALARLWLSPDETRGVHSFAYVSVSDGVGVGLVINGEPLRGDAHTAGEFGHVSLDPRGPACVCGKRGCWEALVCNAATVARYAERAGGAPAARATTVEDVVRRAAHGEPAAVAAITETGHAIGRGLAAVVSAFNPGRVYVGGEVTAAWDILEAPMRTALAEGTLTAAGHATPVVPDASQAEYRLLGAVALVAAPTFAAPSVG